MPRDEYDDTQDDSQDDNTGSYDAGGQDMSDNDTDPQQAMANADPQEVDAHRGLLGEAMSMLQGQGVNTQALAGQAGVGTTDPSQMSHGDLISMAQTLAQQHPEVLQMVAQRFPAAQGLLGSVLGGGQAAGGGGGGMLDGLMGKIFGG